jgi:HlyD family secretion protein
MEIKNTFLKVKSFALSHKILSVVILAVVISAPFVVNYFLPKTQKTVYVTQAVKKGDISVSVSGTGQVSSLKEVSLTSKVAGDVTGVYVESGEEVTKGSVLFSIDSTDQQSAVKSAELAVETAEVKLEEMKEPVDELTLFQAENALTSAQESLTQAQDNLEKSYDDSFTDVSNAFLDLPSVMIGLNDILFLHSITESQQNIDFYATAIDYYKEGKGTQYRNDFYTKYADAKAKYDANLADYKATSRSSDKAKIEALITETYETAKAISEAIRSANNLIEFYKYTLTNAKADYNTTADTNLTSLSGYTSKTNSHLSTLLSASTGIANYKKAITTASNTIKEKELTLDDVKEGYTDLEIRTQELAVEEKKQALTEAQNDLYNCSVRAPFSGIIASVGVSKGDTASTGTTLGSIITKDKIATITLNEVDIAKIKVGQKVNLTFDALDDLAIEGEVSEVDTLGTVSQGVVSYSVKITFSSDNESIKPGMSITANVIVDSVSDVLTVPSTAVKTMGGKSYVEVLNNGVTEKKTVETGLTDDATTEIKSGLTEGEKVVTSTSTGTTKKTTTTTTTTKSSNSSNNQGGPGGGVMMGF